MSGHGGSISLVQHPPNLRQGLWGLPHLAPVRALRERDRRVLQAGDGNFCQLLLLRQKKKMEKPQSSGFFCGLDNVSCAECLEAAVCCPPWHSGCFLAPLGMLLSWVLEENAEGHVGEDGRTGKCRENKPQRARSRAGVWQRALAGALPSLRICSGTEE